MQKTVAESTGSITLVDVDGTLLMGQSYKCFFLSMWRSGQRRLRLCFGILMAWPSHMARKKTLACRLKSQARWAWTMAWVLGGATPQEIVMVLERSTIRNAVRPEVISEIRERQQEGSRVILASTAVVPVVAWLAQIIGADDFVATRVEQRNGCYTGRITGPICNGEQKIAAAEALAARWMMRIDWAESWAYSDGIPDLPMLEKVGHPVVVEPDPYLARVAQERNWRVM